MPTNFPGWQKAADTPSSNVHKRGFASMDPSRQRDIASTGGIAAHQKGTAHEFNSDEAREAGRKGGLARAAKRRASQSVGTTTLGGGITPGV